MYEERFLEDVYNRYSESMEPFAEWFARKACKASVREDVGDDSDDHCQTKKRRVYRGRGPISSIFLAREKDPSAFENWGKHNPEAPSTGVRICPWDE